MHSPVDAYGQFFETLVGDEARVTALKDRLAVSVNTYQGEDFRASYPYIRLGLAMTSAIDEAAFQIVDESLADETELGFRSGDLISIALNGETAMRRTVGVLQTVGDIYAAKAKAPQRLDRVTQSAELALLRLYGMAFMDRTITAVNLAAYQHGLNPRSRVQRFVLNHVMSIDKALEFPHWSRRAFTVSQDEDGQLHVKPRFKPNIPEETGRQCPATKTRVGEPGKQTKALGILIKSVGAVAVTEIFPHYFPISGLEASIKPAAAEG